MIVSDAKGVGFGSSRITGPTLSDVKGATLTRRSAAGELAGAVTTRGLHAHELVRIRWGSPFGDRAARPSHVMIVSDAQGVGFGSSHITGPSLSDVKGATLTRRSAAGELVGAMTWFHPRHLVTNKKLPVVPRDPEERGFVRRERG